MCFQPVDIRQVERLLTEPVQASLAEVD